MNKLKRFLKNLIVHEDYISRMQNMEKTKRLEREDPRVISNIYPKFM